MEFKPNVWGQHFDFIIITAAKFQRCNWLRGVQLIINFFYYSEKKTFFYMTFYFYALSQCATVITL